MNELTYQRSIIAFHGCDEAVVTNVLTLGHRLKPSENDYDWLGRGVYFWEYGPQRALEWAKASKKIKKPAILGAIINLGSCFDLLDTANTQLLKGLFPLYCEASEKKGVSIPQNLPAQGEATGDLVKRHLDCAFINWSLDYLENEGFHFHSVRGVFSEGDAAFAGSKIMDKSHIQIAVREVDASLVFSSLHLTIGGYPDDLTCSESAQSQREAGKDIPRHAGDTQRVVGSL